MKKTILFLFLTVLLLSGCRSQSEPSETSAPESPITSRSPLAVLGWNELHGLSITVITTPITTKTKTIELELTNSTEQACRYSNQNIQLEKLEGTLFRSVVAYNDDHDILELLEAGKTVRQSMSIAQLKPGTYRFAFVQDWNDEAKQMNAYISPAFEVTE